MSWHSRGDVWADAEAAQDAILERQDWKCAQCGESLAERSMCGLTTADGGVAIVCNRCGSELNRLRARAERRC